MCFAETHEQTLQTEEMLLHAPIGKEELLIDFMIAACMGIS